MPLTRGGEQIGRARCVGAPIFDDRGSIEASLGLSGTTQKVSPQTMPRILEALKDVARHISMGMGYRAPHRRTDAPQPVPGTELQPL
jgi:DNA-binding IclR family transcriptional regulator